MTNSKKTAETGKDAFTIMENITEETFNTINTVLPQYYQAATNIQQDVLNAAETEISEAIKAGKKFVNKYGVQSAIPDAGAKTVQTSINECVNAFTVGTRMATAALEATRQNIQTGITNARACTAAYGNVADSWSKIYA